MTSSPGHDADRKAPPADSIFEAAAMVEEHLAALRRYNILDTEREKAFDRLTGLAADLFGVEVAFVAFLDTDRQWLQAKAGLGQPGISLASALCSRTVQKGELLSVEDAVGDERAENGLATAEASFRFYAGVPILAPGGHPIGTFSIMDPEPRALSEEENGRLRDLGKMASKALERRQEAREHEQAARRYERLARRFEAVLQDPNVVVGVLSPEGTVLEMNDAALQYVVESKEEVLGLPFWETPWWAEEMKATVRRWVRRAAGGEYVAFEANLRGPDGTTHNIEGRIRPVTDDDRQTDTLIVSARDVTDRLRQAKELRILSKAIGQAQEAILITEANALSEPGPRVMYVNEAFEEMTGWTEEEILGKTPRVLQGPETDREVLDSLREALEAGEEWEGETVNYRKDGTPYRVQWNLAPVRGEDEEIEYWVSVQRDVTERRRREEKLRFLAEGLERVGDKVMITDTDGRIEYVNASFEQVTGFSKEEVLGEPPSTVRSGVQGEAFSEDLWETIRSGKTFRAELVNERKDGTQYVEEEVITPVTDDEGTVTHFVSTGRDVTDRKEAEERLRSTKSFYEQILNQVPIQLAVFSPEAEFEFVNPESVRDPEMREWLTGRTNEDYCRKRGLPPEFGRRRDRTIRRVARGGETDRFEEMMETERGPRHFLRVHSPVTDLDGEVTHVVAFGLDITDRKEQERRVREAKEEAERANRLKSAFLANMSHEIRTPLTSILGFAEAIAGEVGGAKEASEVDLPMLEQFSSLIEQSGRRLMETLTGILNLSKLEAGEINLSIGPVDLAAEAREAVEEFSPQAQEAGVELRADVGEGAVWARADEGGVQIALRNLLSNAIKYTEEGGTVRVRAYPGEDDGVVLEVVDTGIGMDPEETEELFEAFKQASEGVGREYEGTGLGLTVTKEVLDRMSGSIEVKTEKGQGSRFTVRLPEAEGTG